MMTCWWRFIHPAQQTRRKGRGFMRQSSGQRTLTTSILSEIALYSWPQAP